MIVNFGTFFCPILPLVAAIRLIGVFYIKRWSTTKFAKIPTVVFFRSGNLATIVWAWMLAFVCIGIIPLLYFMAYFVPSGARNGAEYDSRWMNTSALVYLDPTSAMDVNASSWYNHPNLFTSGTCDSEPHAECSDCLLESREVKRPVCWFGH